MHQLLKASSPKYSTLETPNVPGKSMLIRRSEHIDHIMTGPKTSRALEVVPGHLNSSPDFPHHFSGDFSIKENGSGVVFDGTVDFVLPQFTSARPKAKLYYELGKQPKDLNEFKVYIDHQGIIVVFEDGALIAAVFDQEIVLDAKGYEAKGTGVWIGKETGPDLV
jgi:hypothetical protein